MNNHEGPTENEIFSKISVPHKANFFVRLDGWKFKKLSETLGVEKPFDEKIAKCLVYSGKILFEKGFNPALIYVVSDELNVLFMDNAPFRGRVEKIDSIMPSAVSSAFTLHLQNLLGKISAVAFDSKIAIIPDENAVVKYLAWRQANAWRNHNNAYAYWFFRKMGYKPLEIARKMKGMKAEEIHETLFKRGINLAKTPPWQRRGILLYKEPAYKKVGEQKVVRWKIKENWNPPLFIKEEGATLIHDILKWVKARRNHNW
ncbi:MAG: tRNA 5'-guanylyltransferase [Candidatus Bathyarchaeota archaeon]|nr:tRNA 5'-guanylyltransferase [Candidatus Bathyarchaeota archaeon]MDW8040906.1 tRNA(His) guanylyltransferase Thg1 family protein [Nitrososphaerota archaeon]